MKGHTPHCQPYIPTPYPIWGIWDPYSPIAPPHNLYGGYEPHAVLYPYPIAYMGGYERHAALYLHPIAYMSPTQPYIPTP